MRTPDGSIDRRAFLGSVLPSLCFGMAPLTGIVSASGSPEGTCPRASDVIALIKAEDPAVYFGAPHGVVEMLGGLDVMSCEGAAGGVAVAFGYTGFPSAYAAAFLAVPSAGPMSLEISFFRNGEVRYRDGATSQSLEGPRGDLRRGLIVGGSEIPLPEGTYDMEVVATAERAGELRQTRLLMEGIGIGGVLDAL